MKTQVQLLQAQNDDLIRLQAQAARSKRVLEIKSKATASANEEVMHSETNARILKLEDGIESLEAELAEERRRIDQEVAAIETAAKARIMTLERRLANCHCK